MLDYTTHMTPNYKVQNNKEIKAVRSGSILYWPPVTHSLQMGSLTFTHNVR